MKLEVSGTLYVVCGATSGFGLAIANQLINEGANIIAIARGREKLERLKAKNPKKIEIIQGDITKSPTILDVKNKVKNKKLCGLVINAGGPPVMSFAESKLED